jgi:hypothetical protein
MRMAPAGYRPPGYRPAVPGVGRDRALTRVAVLAGGGSTLVAAIAVLVAALGSAEAKGGVAAHSSVPVLASGVSASGDGGSGDGGSGDGGYGGTSVWSDGSGPDPSGGADSASTGPVSVMPADSDAQSGAAPNGGPVGVVPRDSEGSDSSGAAGSSGGSGVPAVAAPTDSGSSGDQGGDQGINAAPVVCNRVVPDLDALHTALLTATATDVFCVHGSDRKPLAINAVSFARAALGTPYVWGGNGRSDGGFDCSGLTTAAYASAGLHLPRTAQLQYNAMPKLPADSQVQPGDLVFFGSGPRSVTHVGIAISPTQMINAPQSGEVVKVAPLHRRDLVGIARPSAMPTANRRPAAD